MTEKKHVLIRKRVLSMKDIRDLYRISKKFNAFCDKQEDCYECPINCDNRLFPYEYISDLQLHLEYEFPELLEDEKND